MKVKDFIDYIRKDRLELWNQHLLWVKTNGEQGIRCATPEIMESLINETDEEIIHKALDKGFTFEDL